MRPDPKSDWFPGPDQPRADPIAAARAGMRPARPTRFYDTASADERDGAFRLLLDGRPAKTPGRNPLAVPTRALAEALVGEWAAQGELINPTAMPVTRIVNSALDGVAARPAAVMADIARYAGSDLVCYRAAEPERLVREQAAAWDPVLAFAREALGAQFILSQGVMPVAQPERALAAVRARIEGEASPLRLAALHTMTTLAGSVLIALAHAAGRLGADAAFAAAHVDERFQASLWGEDEEAAARHAARAAEFRAASTVYELAG